MSKNLKERKEMKSNTLARLEIKDKQTIIAQKNWEDGMQ